jgi:UDP-N-acetylglucosamine 1-carboxyvinyltransferase
LRVLKADRLMGVDIQTQPYPGFPTDLQSPFMSLLSICEGSSVVEETVFENRLQHVAELQRMGANIRVKGHVAVIEGVPLLSGAPVEATDLRASAALAIAGLAADGTTILQNLGHMDRGYDNFVGKMQALGARITRKVMASS